MKLDLLAFGAHPDDVELSCGGTILSHIASGKKAGIVDLTKGELGTRGSAAIRAREAKHAAQILGVSVRENLRFSDGFFSNDKAHQLEVIKMLRLYQPAIVLANALTDRHPDHGRGAQLVAEACFLAGLTKVETKMKGRFQQPWRPRAVYHYLQDRWLQPNIIVDISAFMERKMEAVKAFSSQFYDPKSKEPVTYIATPQFLDGLYSRAQQLGRTIGVRYGEGFTASRVVGTDNLFNLL